MYIIYLYAQNMFEYASSFNGAIGNWNVAKVTSMIVRCAAAPKWHRAIAQFGMPSLLTSRVLRAHRTEYVSGRQLVQ